MLTSSLRQSHSGTSGIQYGELILSISPVEVLKYIPNLLSAIF